MNDKPAKRTEAIEILIAEDSATQALSLQHLLEQQGYRATVCENGRLALAAAMQRTPTLVIGREYGEGFSYALIERTGPKKWRLRWSSAYAGC